METTDKRFPDLVSILKSWIPWRAEPTSVSRDFWMPDDSCMVCYECDSQFTIFNRRHHCRKCGRVFCAKCTSNFVPANSYVTENFREEELIRVCTFCFKQWEDVTASRDEAQPSGPKLSPSLSTTSLASTKSSVTGNSIASTAVSCTCSSGAYQQASYGTPHSPSQSVHLETCYDKEDMLMAETNMDSLVDKGDHSPTHSRFCLNRSDDDDDDDYGACHWDSEEQRLHNSDEFYDPVDFDESEQSYGSTKMHSAEGTIGTEDICSPVPENSEFHVSLGVGNVEEQGIVNNVECNASSALYGVDSTDAEPMDFENNQQLWLPPEPEDEEDEREAVIFEDDEEDATGEWHYLRSSNSFGNHEHRSRDRSSEEHKKAMKSVVDGHFRALVAQLLQVENISICEEDGKENWLDIITSLSWEAATLLKPDTSSGGGMDPGLYVKVKCLACGRRSDSMVVKGVVCKKNVAHRRMLSKIEKPRFLLLGGALEYQRVTNLLSSFDTLLQQEMDHLKMAVAKIDAHHPNVLLVEKSVSRFAQDYLLAKNISLVLNIKRPLLERLARCTGAQIVPSIDHLSSPKLGHCDSFHVDKFLEEHGSAGQGGKKLLKTLMFFQGCPKPLGCTILLKGSNGDELKKVKHVVQYGVFAAYHLALETCFLADEGASLPELLLKSPITVALPDKPSTVNRSISVIPGYTISSAEKSQSNKSDTNLGFDNSQESGVVELPFSSENHTSYSFRSASTSIAGSFDMHDLPVDRGTSYQDNPRNEHMFSKEEFSPSPSDHQSILVSLSSRCVRKGTVCERAHLFRIKYYGSLDKPLGRYLRDHLFDQSYRCRSCEMPSEAHIYCYTHLQGSLTISVRKLQEFHLTGERDGKIWMWHRCLRCPRVNGLPPPTRRIVMSDAAWGLSFGKFLELSFSNHAAASRVASCGHSLHRDCLRFYGSGEMVACFKYASINVHSVYLPPSKLDFNCQHQEWVQEEATKVFKTTNDLFTAVYNSLRQVEEKISKTVSHDGNTEVLESRRNIIELEGILQKEQAEFEESKQKVTRKDSRNGQPFIDILDVNKLQKQLLLKSYVWDKCLKFAAGSLSNPHEFLMTRNNEDLALRAQRSFISFDALVSTASEPLNGSKTKDGHDQYKQPASDQQNVDLQHVKKTELVSTSTNASDQSDSLESDLGVRKVLSDGQFPNMADLSDTLDAKWRGENGPTLVDASKSKSLTLVESAPAISASENSEESITTDPNNLCAPMMPPRSVECAEVSILVKSLFSDLYASLNKNCDSALIEYHPEYISLFKEFMQQGWARLLPIGVNDTVIPIYDDEPTSAISYALVCPEYHFQISDEPEKYRDGRESSISFLTQDSGNLHLFQSVEDITLESFRSFGSFDDSTSTIYGSKSSLILDPLASSKSMHVRVSFAVNGPHGKVAVKNLKGGKESRMDVLVMENLLFGRNVKWLYDLKGSSRSRYNADLSGNNKVLLDQNLIEAMPTSPIFVGNKAKRLLERAVWNDAAFLASIDVMDYSLLVGVDENKNELVVGIIDFMRQYTWDKHLETWVKASGILGGPKDASPTVISPKQYKKRFRKAMSTYFLVVPDQWSPPMIIPSKSQSDLFQDNLLEPDGHERRDFYGGWARVLWSIGVVGLVYPSSVLYSSSYPPLFSGLFASSGGVPLSERPSIPSYFRNSVQTLINPTVDRFSEAQKLVQPNILYFQGEQLENEEQIGSLVWGGVDVSDSEMLTSFISPPLPTIVYLEIPSGEKIAQAFHSKIFFDGIDARQFGLFYSTSSMGVRYVIYWKSAFSSYAASYFRHALLSVVQSSCSHTWDAFQLAHASFRLYCLRNNQVLSDSSNQKLRSKIEPHLLGDAPKINIPLPEKDLAEDGEEETDEGNGSLASITIFDEDMELRFLVCGLPCTLDACLLSSLEDGLNALLNIEIRGSKLQNRVSAAPPPLQAGNFSRGVVTMRCDISTCSSAHISLLVSGSAQTCFDDQLLECHIKSALIEKTQLVHAVPNNDDNKLSWLNPLNSVSIACGAPVFEVCMRMPTWAAQVLKHLAPEVTYRSLVTLGIASIRGTTVASFEKEDADRLLFFCRRQVKDFVSEETVVSCLPTWSSSLIKGRSMSGLESRPIASDYVFVEHGMACKSAEVSVKNRQRSNIAAMRPIPHPRKHKLLPFFGVPPADVNDGSQVQNNVSQTPHVKHNSLPRAPAIQRKSTSSSLRAQQIIPLNPLPLKKHECNRPSIQVCSEEEFLKDVMQFLILRGHSRLVPQGGISEFPDAILNAKRLDLYNLYREVVSRGGFYVGNGINWKGQVFSKMRNHTATNRMTGVGNTLKRHYETYLLEYELAHDDVDGECCLLCHSSAPGDWVNCGLCGEWAHFGCDRRPGLGTFKDYAKTDGLEYICPHCSLTSYKKKSQKMANGFSNTSNVSRHL
ncbi:Phosphatidylinositol-4-phosphate 5-Kinase [Musa troglodytarum]|uniref:1-phosphatidylinositol-3-phosphate 5-kinase n=1 Tax=Musa troglodytarum TaxID=320322 RepID=A0A9E7JTJ5_9LILI|nr:Phosphatidylinositol-4-phosphate 5-Kinase [Musa troglodytarum]